MNAPELELYEDVATYVKTTFPIHKFHLTDLGSGNGRFTGNDSAPRRPELLSWESQVVAKLAEWPAAERPPA